MSTNQIHQRDDPAHRDPLTGETGSHPLGTGVGAVAGTAAAGALAGTVAGPAGTIVGAAVGAVLGGLAGKGIAEGFNPTVEEAYWREQHPKQSYAKGRHFEEFGPAYRTGYRGYVEHAPAGRSFEESEEELRRRYEQENAALAWDEARPASRAAWMRSAEQRRSGNPSILRSDG